MSTVMYRNETTGLAIGTYAGPARDDAGPRTRVQVTTRAGDYLTLSLEEWHSLCLAVRQLAGVTVPTTPALASQAAEEAPGAAQAPVGDSGA